MLQFRLDAATGTLAPIGEGYAAAASGSGPRHLAFSADGRYAYVLGEMSGTVTTYRVDTGTGALSRVGEAQAVPASLRLAKGVARSPGVVLDATPRIWASDIHVTPEGRFVYVAERTSNSISVLRAEGDGQLVPAGHFAVETQPRGFAIEPRGRYMVVSGEKSPDAGVYAIDAATGALRLLQRHPVGQGANWVEIVSFD